MTVWGQEFKDLMDFEKIDLEEVLNRVAVFEERQIERLTGTKPVRIRDSKAFKNSARKVYHWIKGEARPSARSEGLLLEIFRCPTREALENKIHLMRQQRDVVRDSGSQFGTLGPARAFLRKHIEQRLAALPASAFEIRDFHWNKAMEHAANLDSEISMLEILLDIWKSAGLQGPASKS